MRFSVDEVLRQPIHKIWLDTFRVHKKKRREIVSVLLKRPAVTCQEAALLMINVHALDGFEKVIERGLRDSRVHVRIASCCAARDLTLSDALTEMASGDPSDRVRLWAIQALKRFGDPRWRVEAVALEAPRRLNRYERADWKLLRDYATGRRRDPRPKGTAAHLL